jgi:hypothetical protein
MRFEALIFVNLSSKKKPLRALRSFGAAPAALLVEPNTGLAFDDFNTKGVPPVLGGIRSTLSP